MEQLQILQSLVTDAYTRVIVPYAIPQNDTVVYRAWYDAYHINYYTADHTITLYSDENKRTHKPIAYLNDRYHNQLVAVFSIPNNENALRERPFLRVEIVQYHYTKQFDTQGPLFIITELHEPEL